MLMLAELINIVKLLEENNVETISFKGPLLSQMIYGDITLRQYVDLDILIKKENLELASNILLKNNYKELFQFPEYQKENLKTIGHDITLINKSNGINVELHWTLSSSEFFIDLEKLNYYKNTKYFRLKNRDIRTLSNETHFIYLCIHGNKHLWERIEWLVDLTLFIKKENLDFKEILELSEKIDAERVVLSSLAICKHFFGINLPLYIEEKINKDLNSIIRKYIKKLSNDFSKENQNKHTKQISYIQWYILKSFSNRLKYLKAFFLPTEKDYMELSIKKKFHFIYFFLRPLNILFRKMKSKS